MATLLDETQEWHAHVAQRLRDEQIAWLISNRPNGGLHAVPIGFFWDGEAIWIFTRPNTQKIQNIQHNPQVLLTLDNTNGGVDPISLDGTATVVATSEVRETLEPYVEKYHARFTMLGLNAESLAVQYSQAIRIAPRRIVDVIPAARKASSGR